MPIVKWYSMIYFHFHALSIRTAAVWISVCGSRYALWNVHSSENQPQKCDFWFLRAIIAWAKNNDRNICILIGTFYGNTTSFSWKVILIDMLLKRTSLSLVNRNISGVLEKFPLQEQDCNSAIRLNKRGSNNLLHLLRLLCKRTS